MRISKSGHKGVSRIDQPSKRTHGWYVRVMYNGLYSSKFFSDEKCGGREKGLQKAIRFRNKAEKQLGKPRTDRVIVTNHSKNRTGVIGVRKVVEVIKTKSGETKEYQLYEASWSPEPGVIKRKKVSIDKYGEEEALRRAIRIRKKMERQIYGKSLKAPE